MPMTLIVVAITVVVSYLAWQKPTLMSRLTGFVRDVMIAAALGSSAVADAYIAAFLLPNLFRRVLSEGAFNAAFVPIYTRREAAEGRDSVRAFHTTRWVLDPQTRQLHVLPMAG